MICSEFIVQTQSPNLPVSRACANIRDGGVYAMPFGINGALRMLLARWARRAQNVRSGSTVTESSIKTKEASS